MIEIGALQMARDQVDEVVNMFEWSSFARDGISTPAL